MSAASQARKDSAGIGRVSNDAAFRELKSAYERKGVRVAIEYLNSLTPHRFTSLFRFDGDTLRKVVFFDRQNPGEDHCEDIPVTASYCIFVRDRGETFTVEESKSDERVVGHPKRDTFQCYCGVPLLDRDDRMFGSICHFDFEPAKVSKLDIELLESMARILKESKELSVK